MSSGMLVVKSMSEYDIRSNVCGFQVALFRPETAVASPLIGLPLPIDSN